MTTNALAAPWGIPIGFEKRCKRGVKQFFNELASDSRIEDSERDTMTMKHNDNDDLTINGTYWIHEHNGNSGTTSP